MVYLPIITMFKFTCGALCCQRKASGRRLNAGDIQDISAALLLMVCLAPAEQAMAQWASLLAKRSGDFKGAGDLLACACSRPDGIARTLYD